MAASRSGVTGLYLAGGASSGVQVVIDGQWFNVIGVLRSVPLSPDIDRAALAGWEALSTP